MRANQRRPNKTTQKTSADLGDSFGGVWQRGLIASFAFAFMCVAAIAGSAIPAYLIARTCGFLHLMSFDRAIQWAWLGCGALLLPYLVGVLVPILNRSLND